MPAIFFVFIDNPGAVLYDTANGTANSSTYAFFSTFKRTSPKRGQAIFDRLSPFLLRHKTSADLIRTCNLRSVSCVLIKEGASYVSFYRKRP